LPHGLTALYLAVVIITWGTNYPLMQLAFLDVSPLTFATFRLLGGAGFLLFLLYFISPKKVLPPRAERPKLALISLCQFVSVLGFAGLALLYLPAGRTVTIIYTMPVWVTVFSFLLVRVRPNYVQVLGVFLSISGILLFFDPSVIELDNTDALFALLLALSAAILWGFGAVLYKYTNWNSSVLSQSFWQLFIAGLFLAVLAFVFERNSKINITPTFLIILIWNCIGPTAISVWAWSQVLSSMSATTASQFTMFTPFVGIAASALIFQERLPAVFAISVLLIVIGGIFSLVSAQD